MVATLVEEWTSAVILVHAEAGMVTLEVDALYAVVTTALALVVMLVKDQDFGGTGTLVVKQV